MPGIVKNIRALCASVAILQLASGVVSAQELSDTEIEQAIAVMRASGQSEAQIQQFLQAVEMANQAAAENADVAPSGDQTKDIQNVTGMSDAEMATVGPIAGAIQRRQDGWKAEKLQEEIAAFEARYADKPDVVAVFDGETIAMKLLGCDLTDAYSFQAQGAPREHSKPGPTIGAGRGWSVQSGQWLASIEVRIDGDSYTADLPPDDLAGATFAYGGIVALRDHPAVEATLNFEATCAQ